MRALTISFALLASATAVADTAHGPVATLPRLGDTLNQGGAADWPKLAWLYDAPSADDAAGKIVVHWFCDPKVTACADDLARIITLRDTGKVYIVAYINTTSQRDAKKLDPIRESEGVGKGTVAYGRGVVKLTKQLGIGGSPTSIVVDQSGKVQLVSQTGDAQSLDTRDAKVNDLASKIRDFTTSKDGPTTVAPNQSFTLSYSVQIASWLQFNNQENAFDLRVAKEIHCDATHLAGSQLKIQDHTLVAQVTCSGPKGIYEAAGKIRFGFAGPNNAAGFGDDGTTWKFEIK